MAAREPAAVIDTAAAVGDLTVGCEIAFHAGDAPAVWVMWQHRPGDRCMTRDYLLVCDPCLQQIRRESAEVDTFPCRTCGFPIPAAGYIARLERL